MRALRMTLILAVVLGGLFLAADRLAVKLAEQEAADRIQRSQGLSETPQVSIKGFPFLTQVLDKNLDEVKVDLDGVTATAGGRSIRVTGLAAELHDVRLGDHYSSATADRASGSALISFEDLSMAAPEGVKVSYGGKDSAGRSQVKVTASVDVPLVGRVERSVTSTVSIAGGDKIRLRADAIPGTQIPGLESLIRGKIDFDRELSGLPQSIELDEVTTTRDGVSVSVTGEKVPLAG